MSSTTSLTMSLTMSSILESARKTFRIEAESIANLTALPANGESDTANMIYLKDLEQTIKSLL